MQPSVCLSIYYPTTRQAKLTNEPVRPDPTPHGEGRVHVTPMAAQGKQLHTSSKRAAPPHGFAKSTEGVVLIQARGKRGRGTKHAENTSESLLFPALPHQLRKSPRSCLCPPLFEIGCQPTFCHRSINRSGHAKHNTHNKHRSILKS